MSSAASGSPPARGKALAGRRAKEADRPGRLVPGGGRKNATIRGELDAGAARRGHPDIRDPQRGRGIILHEKPVRRNDPAEQRLGAASGGEGATAVTRRSTGSVDDGHRVLRSDRGRDTL